MTLVLIALNVAVFAVTAAQSGAVMQNHRSDLFTEWMLFPPAVAFFDEWYRLLTSAFLHFGLLHLGLNMLILWILGRAVEPAIGSLRYLGMYLVSALGAAAAVMSFAPTANTAGASGAVFGLMGAYAVIALALRVPARGVLMLIALNVVISFTVPGISIAGHLGGLVTGALAGLLMVVVPRTLPKSVGRAGRETVVWSSAAVLAAVAVGYAVYAGGRIHFL